MLDDAIDKKIFNGVGRLHAARNVGQQLIASFSILTHEDWRGAENPGATGSRLFLAELSFASHESLPQVYRLIVFNLAARNLHTEPRFHGRSRLGALSEL